MYVFNFHWLFKVALPNVVCIKQLRALKNIKYKVICEIISTWKKMTY